MKPILLAGVSALVMLSGPAAVAQTVSVEIAPEQRTVIREYVTKQRVRPVQLRERVTVGATLPADVEIHTAPAEWGPAAARYRYIYSDNRVYFVEPESRRVVHILD